MADYNFEVGKTDSAVADVQLASRTLEQGTDMESPKSGGNAAQQDVRSSGFETEPRVDTKNPGNVQKTLTPPRVVTPPGVAPVVPRYSSGYKKVGKALFFSCPKTMVGERKRCQEDINGIRTKLSELGFDTTSKPLNDASQDQMETAIEEVCDTKYSDYGMLVCVVLSNADHGLIYPQERPRFSVTKLSEPLSQGIHPVWAGKPKIFILLTPFFEVKIQSLGPSAKKEVVMPSEADFLYLWSFVPESYGKRDELKRILAKACTDKESLNRKLEELCRDEKKREKILKESSKLLKRRMNSMKMSLTAEHLVRELSEAGQRDLGDVFARVINSVVSEVEGHQGAEKKGGSMPTERMIYMVSQLRKLLVLSAATITHTVEVENMYTTPELAEAAGGHSNAYPEKADYTPKKGVTSPEKEKEETSTKTGDTQRIAQCNEDKLSAMASSEAEEMHSILKPGNGKRIMVLLNVNTFENRKNNSHTQKDTLTMQNTFCKLGFDVDTFKETGLVYAGKAEETIKRALATIDQEPRSHSCFALAIMTHGTTDDLREMLYFSDDRELAMDDIVSWVNDCKGLKGKPKLFFIQASRGQRLFGTHALTVDGRGAVTKSSLTKKPHGEMFSHECRNARVPLFPDCLISWATSPNYVAFQTTTSPYIDYFGSTLENHHDQLDLLTMVTIANGRVVETYATYNDQYEIYDGRKQMPWMASMLRKKVFLTPPHGGTELS